MIAYLYLGGAQPACLSSSNTSVSAGDPDLQIDIADLSALIDYEYISFTPCEICDVVK